MWDARSRAPTCLLRCSLDLHPQPGEIGDGGDGGLLKRRHETLFRRTVNLPVNLLFSWSVQFFFFGALCHIVLLLPTFAAFPLAVHLCFANEAKCQNNAINCFSLFCNFVHRLISPDTKMCQYLLKILPRIWTACEAFTWSLLSINKTTQVKCPLIETWN